MNVADPRSEVVSFTSQNIRCGMSEPHHIVVTGAGGFIDYLPRPMQRLGRFDSLLRMKHASCMEGGRAGREYRAMPREPGFTTLTLSAVLAAVLQSLAQVHSFCYGPHQFRPML